MKKLILLSTILLSVIMVRAQKHADSIYLYDKTGKYYKTEAAIKSKVTDKKTISEFKGAYKTKDTAVYLSISDYRLLAQWASQPMTDAQRDAVAKFWLPELNKRAKTDTNKVGKKHN